MVNFPSSFDTNSTLYIAVNNKRTTLTSAISAGTLTIPVLDTTGFPDSGFITINSTPSNPLAAEAITYSSKDATNFFAAARGADGTTATAHVSGAKVDLTVVAAHHNSLKDAVLQLEYFVGVSGSENFLRQDDTGNVTVGGTLDVPGSSTFGTFSVNTFTANSGTITLLGGSNATFNQGRFATSLTVSGLPVLTSVPVDKAIVGGTNITVISGASTITINSTSSGEGKAILGDSFISVVTGTNSINLSADAITSGGPDVIITSGTNQVRIGVNNRALIGTGGNTVTSGTNTITITSFRDEFVTASGFLQTQIGASQAGANAIVGSDGITVISGAFTTTVQGFRPELLTASGFLQGQITSVQNQVTAGLPTEGFKDFTTPSVDMGGGVRQINESFNNRSLIRKLKISPVASGVNSYFFQFFTKDTFNYDDLLEYEATASGVYVDNDLWFHDDDDLTSEMHLLITNNSLVDSAFIVQLKFERFF